MLKAILVAGIALILVGGLFYGAAYAMGESRMDERVGEFHDSIDQLENIENIKIDVDVAKVNINRISGNEIVIDAQNIIVEDFEWTETYGNKTLAISYKPRGRWFGFDFINIPGLTRNRNPVINISIPEHMIFTNFDINGGVGEYTIEYVNTDSFRLNGGVGRVTVQESRIDKLRIDAGVGAVNVTGDIGEMNINAGVGAINVRGSAARDISIDGGVGSINIDVAGDINNYDVRVDAGVGAIRINGERGNSMRNADAPYRLTASGGVGSITVNMR